MTGSSLANGFIVLTRKPMVLLLLFPVQALAPFSLLLIPLLSNMPDDDTSVFLRIMLVFGALAVFLVVILARAILLMPPAVELLNDGVAGAQTPPGWFLRGIKNHWWKRFSIALAEWSVSSFIGILVQLAMNFAILPLTLMVVPFTEDENMLGYMAAVVLLLYAVIGIVFFALFIFRFLLECYGAFLLPALAGGGFAAAFKTVFSRSGTGKLPKLVGGRFLVSAADAVIAVVFAAGYLIAIGFGMVVGISDSFASMAILAALMSVCILITSYLSVYRTAFEFCVFQEISDDEKKAAEIYERMALTKKGE